jgi:hypothetical protein
MRLAWWQAWPVPWYVHRFAIVSRVAPACLPYQLRMDWAYHIDASGWVSGPIGPTTPEKHRQAVERARQEYAGYFIGFRLDGAATRELCELLDLCRSRGIATALVLMPEGDQFRSWYPAPVWAEMQAFLSRLSRQYGSPVINGRAWIREEDFADSHHLLVRGAGRFTERLGREVLPLLRFGRRDGESFLPNTADDAVGRRSLQAGYAGLCVPLRPLR